MEPKTTTLAPRSLQCIWFVAVALLSEEEVFLKKGTPPHTPHPSHCDLFFPTLDPPLGRYG